MRIIGELKWKDSRLVSMAINFKEATKEYEMVYEQLFLSKD